LEAGINHLLGYGTAQPTVGSPAKEPTVQASLPGRLMGDLGAASMLGGGGVDPGSHLAAIEHNRLLSDHSSVLQGSFGC
jgi:hypothetical protein